MGCRHKVAVLIVVLLLQRLVYRDWRRRERESHLERGVPEGVSEGPRVGDWVVRRQLGDDHVEHARLPPRMQPYARCVVHHLRAHDSTCCSHAGHHSFVVRLALPRSRHDDGHPKCAAVLFKREWCVLWS